LAAEAEDALGGPDDIGISGYSYRERALWEPLGGQAERRWNKQGAER